MTSRVATIRFVFLLGMTLLVLRLAHLQLIHGGFYRRLAENNRLRVVPDAAPRGLIVDRHGQILAGNRTLFRVALIPQEVDQMDRTLQQVSAMVAQPVDRLRQSLVTNRTLAFIPATIVSQVPKPLALRLEEARLTMPGVLVRAETVRAYPSHSSAAHLLGYLSELERLPTQLYWSTLGIEGQYPTVTLKVTVYTLSLDRAWLSV